jgi:hypothetical protein
MVVQMIKDTKRETKTGTSAPPEQKMSLTSSIVPLGAQTSTNYIRGIHLTMFEYFLLHDFDH